LRRQYYGPHRARIPIEAVEEQADAFIAEVVGRLAYGCQGGAEQWGPVDLIEADDGYFVWDGLFGFFYGLERSRGHPVVGYENGLRGPFLPKQLLHSLLSPCFAKVGDTDQGVVQRYSRLLQGRAIAQETLGAGCSCQGACDASDVAVPVGNEMADRLDRS